MRECIREITMCEPRNTSNLKKKEWTVTTWGDVYTPKTSNSSPTDWKKLYGKQWAMSGIVRLMFVRLNVREEDWRNGVEGSGGSKEWLWLLQILGETSGSHNKEQKIFTLPWEDLVSFLYFIFKLLALFQIWDRGIVEHHLNMYRDWRMKCRVNAVE
jgi:hypothetical protein